MATPQEIQALMAIAGPPSDDGSGPLVESGGPSGVGSVSVEPTPMPNAQPAPDPALVQQLMAIAGPPSDGWTGDDEVALSPPSKSETALGGLANMLPLGIGDELGAGASALLTGGTDGQSFGDAYDQSLASIRAGETAFRQQHPTAAFLTQLPGYAALGEAAPLGVAGDITAALGKNLIAKALGLSAEGGLYGAASGFGAGEGGIQNRLNNAVPEAATGAIAVPALGGALGLFGKALGLPGQAINFFRGATAADASSLADPQVQLAREAAQRMGFITPQAAASPRIGQGTADAVSALNSLASDQNLPTSIAAQFESAGGKGGTNINFAQDLQKGMPQIVKSGLLNSGSVSEMTAKAAARLEQINATRDQAANTLDQLVESSMPEARSRAPLFHNVPEETTTPGNTVTSKDNFTPNIFRKPSFQMVNMGDVTTQATPDLTARVSQAVPTGASRIPEPSIPGMVSTRTPAIQQAATDLANRASELRQTAGFPSDVADSIDQTSQGILRKIGYGGLKPSEVVQQNQNLNMWRRALQEFDSSTAGKLAAGNTPKTQGQLQGSIQAIRTLQRALQGGLESSLSDLSKASGTKLDPAYFTNLNNEAEGLYALKRSGSRYLANTAEDFPSGTPVAETLGGPRVTARPRYMLAGLANRAVQGMRDDPTAILQEAKATLARDTNAMKNIQALQSLNQNPAALQALKPSLTASAIKNLPSLALSALSAVASVLAHDPNSPAAPVRRSVLTAPHVNGGIPQSIFAAGRHSTPSASVFSASNPLAAAVAHVENGKGDPNAVSSKGAVGLMQVEPIAAREVMRAHGIDDSKMTDAQLTEKLKDPKTNVAVGRAYLGMLMKKYNNNVQLALAAYNGGPTRVSNLLDKTGGTTLSDINSQLPAETQAYVPKVASIFAKSY